MSIYCTLFFHINQFEINSESFYKSNGKFHKHSEHSKNDKSKKEKCQKMKNETVKKSSQKALKPILTLPNYRFDRELLISSGILQNYALNFQLMATLLQKTSIFFQEFSNKAYKI